MTSPNYWISGEIQPYFQIRLDSEFLGGYGRDMSQLSKDEHIKCKKPTTHAKKKKKHQFKYLFVLMMEYFLPGEITGG